MVMKHYTRIIRQAIFSLSLCVGLVTGGALTSISAQSKGGQGAGGTDARKKSEGRDPFVRYRPASKPKKDAPVPIAPPTIQERIDRYKAQKMAAMTAQLPAPKPTTALLLSEMQVTGIFRTPRGYAAMVEATPIKLSYVIYPGEMFYDGQLVAIEEDRLVFRHETRWTDGRRERTVETVPLRKSNTVTDSLTTLKGGAATVNSISGQPGPQNLQKLSLPGKNWALEIALPFFDIRQDQVSPDGQARNLLATMDQQGIIVTVMIGPAPPKGSSEELRDRAAARLKTETTIKEDDLKVSEYKQMPTLEYTVKEFKGTEVQQKHLNAYLFKDGVWINIHFSKMQFKAGEEHLFYQILDSVKFTESANAISRLFDERTPLASRAGFNTDTFGASFATYERALRPASEPQNTSFGLAGT